MPDDNRRGFKNSLAAFCCAVLMAAQPVQSESSGPGLGKPAPKSLVKAWTLDVFPDGSGLPRGHGNATEGEALYQRYCQSCHGVDGTGGSAEELAGAAHGLTDDPPDKTIGTYWPYATTVFDFIRRSMPMDAPGILDDNQVYAVTAYLLYMNDIIDKDETMDAVSLPKVKMPNRNGFIHVYEEENGRR